MLPEAHLVHASPGRVRIRIASKKRDNAFFSALREQISKFPMIRNVEVNPLTGSVLVIHDLNGTDVDLKAVSEYTEMTGLFKLRQPNPAQTSVREQIATVFSSANDRVKGATAGELDLPTTASLGLLGMGLYQIGKGNVAAPAWHVAFWYALNIFLQGRSGDQEAIALQPKQEVQPHV
jgi:hypothetical protein